MKKIIVDTFDTFVSKNRVNENTIYLEIGEYSKKYSNLAVEIRDHLDKLVNEYGEVKDTAKVIFLPEELRFPLVDSFDGNIIEMRLGGFINDKGNYKLYANLEFYRLCILVDTLIKYYKK